MAKRSTQSSQHSPKRIVKTEETKRDLSVVKTEIANLTHKDDPNHVLREAEKKLVSLDFESYSSNGDDPIFKAMTLREFDNGTLLSVSVNESHRTFGIDLMRKLQTEYGCVSPSEKATAELIALNFVRILDLERRMTNAFKVSGEALGQACLAILSKDLDRATRHYLALLQTLRMLKQPPMQLNIKANTAVVGQNQIIQTTTNNEPK